MTSPTSSFETSLVIYGSIDNYTATRRNIIELVKACDTTQRYVYKVIQEHVEGNRGKK